MSNLPHPPSDDEIRARLKSAADRATRNPLSEEPDPFLATHKELAEMNLPEVPDELRRAPEDDPEFGPRMKALHDRVSKVTEHRQITARQAQHAQRSENSSTYQLGVGLSIAYMFLGFPFVGVLIGAGVNYLTHSSLGIPIGGFVGILVGCFTAISALNRANQNR